MEHPEKKPEEPKKPYLKGSKSILTNGQRLFMQTDSFPLWKVTCRGNCVSYVIADSEEQIVQYFAYLKELLNHPGFSSIDRVDNEGIYIADADEVKEAVLNPDLFDCPIFKTLK